MPFNSPQAVAAILSMRFLWPRTEVVVSVLEKPYPWHWYGELLGRLSSATYFVIPFYINEGGWEFSYRVTHRDMLPKTYKYDITARQFYWTLLIPFFWMNVFTYNLDDAVQSTTVQLSQMPNEMDIS